MYTFVHYINENVMKKRMNIFWILISDIFMNHWILRYCIWCFDITRAPHWNISVFSISYLLALLSRYLRCNYYTIPVSRRFPRIFSPWGRNRPTPRRIIGLQLTLKCRQKSGSRFLDIFIGPSFSPVTWKNQSRIHM